MLRETTKDLRTDKALPFRADVPQAMSTRVFFLNLTAIVLPLLSFAAVVVSLWGRGFSWVDGGLLLGM